MTDNTVIHLATFLAGVALGIIGLAMHLMKKESK